MSKKEILAFYDMHFKDFGDVPQAVGWTSGGQTRRHEALLDIAGDISGKEILDFGCGKGDLFHYIRKRGISLQYCGIDINENLIRCASKKFPEAEFIAADIDEVDIGREFDVVFLCGVFNLRVAGINNLMRDVLKKLFVLCRESLHLNVLSHNTALRSVQLFYVKPEDILQFAVTKLSPSVILRQGIVEGDIFLSVFKQNNLPKSFGDHLFSKPFYQESA